MVAKCIANTRNFNTSTPHAVILGEWNFTVKTEDIQYCNTHFKILMTQEKWEYLYLTITWRN